MRHIEDILHFRKDFSPFLVHLTKSSAPSTASQVLESILTANGGPRLLAGSSAISDAKYGGNTTGMSPDKIKRFFGAICLTETPLNEVHCLLEIDNRAVQLEPYGIVFLKDRLAVKGVSPVLYLNNEQRDKDAVAQALFSLIHSNQCAAKKILPLIAVFGAKLNSPGAAPQTGRSDWRWEREWRLPASEEPLTFTHEDVFVGLCKEEEIARFEALFPHVQFIDPRRNMKWYAKKLIDARQRLDLKHSVV